MLAVFKKTKLPKKRYIALGVLLFELASLPAAAHIVMQSLPTEAPAQTNAVLIDETDSQQRYVVTSNAAFHIKADDFQGDIKVTLHKSGQVGETRFGDNAQMPGAALSCATVDGNMNTVYQSKRGITIADGEPLSQAVLVVIDYKADSGSENAPEIKFDTGVEENSTLIASQNCVEQLLDIKGA